MFTARNKAILTKSYFYWENIYITLYNIALIALLKLFYGKVNADTPSLNMGIMYAMHDDTIKIRACS